MCVSPVIHLAIIRPQVLNLQQLFDVEENFDSFCIEKLLKTKDMPILEDVKLLLTILIPSWAIPTQEIFKFVFKEER
jgi:hypothetical protein